MADSPSSPPPPPSPVAAGSEHGADHRRDEMHAAPPFLTWRAIYGIVIGALVVQVVIYAALTASYR